jgi:hypothetical protein
MGDDDVSAIGLASAKASASALRAQLNRFADPSAPVGYRLFTTKLASSGPLDLSVGARVGAVLMKRMSAPGYPADAKLASLAGQVMGDATGSVLTANLAYATEMIRGYADAHGVPSTSSTFLGVPIMYLLVAGAGAVILGMRKKGK